jgi:NAD(P)-dependent dehydrogenase (short-subunit alcohol dehydrogenase family)
VSLVGLEFEADVRDQASLDAAAASIAEALGGIDVVVANAGIASYGTTAQIDPAAFARTIDINLTGVFPDGPCRSPPPRREARYVLVIASFAPLGGLASYTASKAGVESFARGFAMEVAHLGIDVGSARPSWIRCCSAATPRPAPRPSSPTTLEDHLFDGGFCADTDDREAIARRAWELAAEREGGELDPELTYVIGDTPHDVACARAIGARSVAVASGPFGREDLEAAEPWLLLDDLPDPDRFADLLGLPERQPRRARA